MEPYCTHSRSHRFRNVQVEVLYQRYFLRMNQNNMASLLGLLICISLVLIVINHVVYPSSQHSILQVRSDLKNFLNPKIIDSLKKLMNP